MFQNYTDKQIQKARIYAAKIHRKLSVECFAPDFGFADHITEEYKRGYSEYHRNLADEIEKGLHDGNFTVQQRMYEYLSGDSVPFLA